MNLTMNVNIVKKPFFLQGDVTDRAREARTKAYVNGDCVDNSNTRATLHKCPSAPCIPLLQSPRSEVCTVRYQNENQQSTSDKWLD